VTAYIIVIITALVFDFINGWHDSANSIATEVGTKTLTPLKAVMLAAFGNLIAVAFFELHVAKTIGKGLVDSAIIDLRVIFAALTGAIVWNIITWHFGIPSSSSHALMGGLGGAALAKSGPVALLAGGWAKPVLFIFLASAIGMALGMVTKFALTWILHGLERVIPGNRLQSAARGAQLVSSMAFSIGHGGNDAQKTMGIITVTMVAAGWQTSFDPPLWAALACHIAMALGTMAGGWRIVRTMGAKLCDLKAPTGVAAELSGAFTL
jgi:inorganic phosphate transporter, PiT family